MRSGQAWNAAQAVGVATTGLLVGGLALRPEPSLFLLWKVIIPLVPAVLLISPLLWRNVCPLATLEMIAQSLTGDRPPARRWAKQGAAVGVLLLGAMVPARHVVFNTDGPVLAITIVAVAAMAIGGGMAFDAKGGFCNAVCPVLPVERLYGQSPFLEIENPRCATCSGCTPACIDLGPRTAPFRALGRARRGTEWTRTVFGAFAAAFPGFVLGYFTTADGPPGTALSTYAQVAGWSGVSWVATTTAVVWWRIEAWQALPILGALAAGGYYAFAAPQIAAAVGLQGAGGILRAAFLSLVAMWWWRADQRRREAAWTRPAGQARPAE
jgi:hypothetical protein